MDPYNQRPQPNPYDFITNSTPTPSGPKFGGSMKSRIILVVGGLFLLLIVFWVISTILTAGQRQAITNLKRVAAEQQEIVRISDIGVREALGSNTKAYASTVNLVMLSGQKELTEELATHKIKLSKAEQASRLNPKTEELLEAAASNNQFDEVITQTLNELLEEHKKTIKTAHDSASSQTAKEALNKAYNNVDILLNARSPDAR